VDVQMVSTTAAFYCRATGAVIFVHQREGDTLVTPRTKHYHLFTTIGNLVPGRHLGRRARGSARKPAS
jgi:hypothetical protein